LARHREIVDRSDGIENSEPQHQGGIFPIAGNEVSFVEFFQPAMFDGLDQVFWFLRAANIERIQLGKTKYAIVAQLAAICGQD